MRVKYLHIVSFISSLTSFVLYVTKPTLTKTNENLSYRRDSAGRRSLRRSGSFKVTDFGTNRKPMRILTV